MLELRAEKDLETLRQAALILERENERLIEKNLELQRRLMRLQNATPEQMQRYITQLEQQLRQAVQRVVGGNSEKTKRDPKAADPEQKEAKPGHGPKEQPELPKIEQLHELDDADRDNCATCGGVLHVMKGQFEESEEISVVERKFVLLKHMRQKYACDCHSVVETALGPDKLIEGGRYSIDFAVEVAVQKYLDHLPLERQVRIMAREGLETNSQTLWDQLNALASKLDPAWTRLQQYVLSHAVIGADETHWKYLEKGGGERKQKRWQAWTIVCEDAVCYRILPDRDSEAARQILGGYKGFVVADGYGVYEHLAKHDGIILVNCWAHARRKFIDLGDAITEELRAEILDLIGKLYAVEKLAPSGPEGLELRRQLRNKDSRAIVGSIREWCFEQLTKVLPRSALAGAIRYLTDRWTELTRFLDDPRLPLDNNWSERSLRGLVVGRKNHYGSKSERGTKVAALFYSLLESAKLCGLEPKTYLRLAITAALRGQTIPLPHEISA